MYGFPNTGTRKKVGSAHYSSLFKSSVAVMKRLRALEEKYENAGTISFNRHLAGQAEIR